MAEKPPARWTGWVALGLKVAALALAIGYVVLFVSTAFQPESPGTRGPSMAELQANYGLGGVLLGLLCRSIPLLLFLALSLGAIWFPEQLDAWFMSWPGYSGAKFGSPAGAIMLMGWAVLLVPLLVILFRR